MCSLSTTVNNHSTEETDVVQHNEETFEDHIVIFFPPFFLVQIYTLHFIWLSDELKRWSALFKYLYSTLHFMCKIIFVIDVKLYVKKEEVQVVLYLSIDFGNQTGEETAA